MKINIPQSDGIPTGSVTALFNAPLPAPTIDQLGDGHVLIAVGDAVVDGDEYYNFHTEQWKPIMPSIYGEKVSDKGPVMPYGWYRRKKP
jgi:hypothetical protein